jgi:ABC-2 type transport system ATP-binding protein
LIDVVQVSKHFGKIAALTGVDLRIGAGERVAFVGANGSGKTTLLRALLGLLRVDGCIRIAGVDVARSPELALRHVAYIPQVAPPLDASVSEVVRAHAALRGITSDSVAERARHLGLALSSVNPLRFRDLSGGMRQKLLAALALATRAPILIGDEPTANLDADARGAFFAAVAALPADSIVLLCSHRAEELESSVGRIIEFSEGRVVRDASRPRVEAPDARSLVREQPSCCQEIAS